MTQSPEDGPGFELRIVRGNPTDAQIAALLAVVALLRVGSPRVEPAQHVQPWLRRRRWRRHRSAVSWRWHQ